MKQKRLLHGCSGTLVVKIAADAARATSGTWLFYESQPEVPE